MKKARNQSEILSEETLRDIVEKAQLDTVLVPIADMYDM